MKLLFVPNPHVRLDRTWAAPYVPHELLSAMAVAEQAGAEPALFDVNCLVEHGSLKVERGIWNAAADLLAEAEPDAVVLETWTGTLHHTLLLAQAARRRLPDVPLVLAGSGTSPMAVEALTRFGFLDGVIRGDLEPAVEVIAWHGGLASAPGLVRRSGTGIEDAALAVVADLDSLPRTAFHLSLLEPGDAIPIETGRGCPQGCTFCALAGHWPRVHRARRPENIVREMEELSERHPQASFDLTQDPVFFNDAERLARVCELLDGAKLRWTCHARADRLGPRQIEALARAGCVGILFGIESGCPRQQELLGKRIDLGLVRATVAEAARAGLDCRASFVVGLPEEGRESLRRTFDLALALRRAGASDVAVQPLRAYPGSAIHERFRSTLVFEPILCTAAPDDVEARALISAHPDLLSASYRVPGLLTRDELISAWLSLGALGCAVEALDRHGQSACPGSAGLPAAGPLPDSLEPAVEQLAERLRGIEARGVDRQTWRDLLAWERALFCVGREQMVEGAPADEALLVACSKHPESIRPHVAVPWRLVELRTALERLIDGDLKQHEHAGRQHVLVTKIAAAGEAAFYTRKSYSLESFLVDPLAREALPLCGAGLDVLNIGLAVAARQGLPPGETVTACASLVADLAREGVLRLQLVER